MVLTNEKTESLAIKHWRSDWIYKTDSIDEQKWRNAFNKQLWSDQ